VCVRVVSVCVVLCESVKKKDYTIGSVDVTELGGNGYLCNEV
jgi:hypothetical protein